MKPNPCPRRHRGLSKPKMLDLVRSRWIATHQNVLITGQTGCGKSFLACALGEKARRDGYRILYFHTPRLFGQFFQTRADGTYPRLLQRLAKAYVLILDDLGCAPLDAGQRRDLRDVVEDRYGLSSTIVTSQLDPDHWHSFPHRSRRRPSRAPQSPRRSPTLYPPAGIPTPLPLAGRA